ncbi:hypothetical protein AKJ57_05185 [candidate division MSBL1 archaeon SCGC-AAA259A05]|uniref:Flavin reductase like domain-containing protein n=1 Tax=candidate division MSBL1 archaeon SCGC-AAA259A05 TaxID=1698259 RepID=A0A133U5S8_9EURY|nr:hypothetical protein AKJ57_05185 [candidate division MSBL1 archaeon SCGC-AAA259A05]
MDLDSARHLLHPKLTVLATCVDGEGNPNIITLAWAMPTSIDPSLVAISVGETRYSHDLIHSVGEFVVNIPSSDLLDEVKLCGSRTGLTADKFEETDLTPVDSEEVAVPLIEECPAHIECELVDEFRTGDHTIFVGEIVHGSVEEGIFDESSGTFDMDKFEPVCHVGGSEFVTSGRKI